MSPPMASPPASVIPDVSLPLFSLYFFLFFMFPALSPFFPLFLCSSRLRHARPSTNLSPPLGPRMAFSTGLPACPHLSFHVSHFARGPYFSPVWPSLHLHVASLTFTASVSSHRCLCLGWCLCPSLSQLPHPVHPALGSPSLVPSQVITPSWAGGSS